MDGYVRSNQSPLPPHAGKLVVFFALLTLTLLLIGRAPLQTPAPPANPSLHFVLSSVAGSPAHSLLWRTQARLFLRHPGTRVSVLVVNDGRDSRSEEHDVCWLQVNLAPDARNDADFVSLDARGPACGTSGSRTTIVSLWWPNATGTAEQYGRKECALWSLAAHGLLAPVVPTDDPHDFMVRGDDDTYFIVPALRRFLQQFPPTVPQVWGRLLTPTDARLVPFLSGGAGIAVAPAVLGSLRRSPWGETAHELWRSCSTRLEGAPTDITLANLLARHDLYPTDSRDTHGLERFHPLELRDMLRSATSVAWLSSMSRLPVTLHLSPTSVSTHYMSADAMLCLDDALFATTIDPPPPTCIAAIGLGDPLLDEYLRTVRRTLHSSSPPETAPP